jgi:MerR family redox-sensitive transcriptional activator SoxR
MDARDLLTVTEVARRSGFAASALRFYEEQGLIDATRSPSGRRRYERSVLRRLAFIRAASNIGLSLKHCAFANPQDLAASTPAAPGAAYLPDALRRPHPVR